MSTLFKKRGGPGESCSAQSGNRRGNCAQIDPTDGGLGSRRRRDADDRCWRSAENSPKTVAERKRDQRARDEELAQLGLQRLKIYVPLDEIGDYLRSRGIIVHEDDPEPLARGVEMLIKKLLDESRDRSELR
jgi:hypothetical protein